MNPMSELENKTAPEEGSENEQDVTASYGFVNTQQEEQGKSKAQLADEASFLADIEATLVPIRSGQTVTGKVVQITEDEVCVNIGYKSDGLIKKADLVSTDLKIGDEVDVDIVRVNDGEGNVLLSQRNVVMKKSWDEILKAEEAGEYIIGIGKQVVKGGLIADVKSVRAFIPASQLSQRFVDKIEGFIGQEMKLKIIEIDKAKKRIVCSRKAVVQEESAAKKAQAWDKLEEGNVVHGTVRRLTDFGAFVDIGGVDGLIHVSDLSWGRVRHPSDVVQPNQEVDVLIKKLDKEGDRIHLSLRETQPRPWDIAESKYHVDTIVEGTVVRITTFGAFVELEPGLDGLVHISQCAINRISKVEDALEVGQKVRVKLLGVDKEAKRISLSIRAVLEDEAFAYEGEIPGEDDISPLGDDIQE
jgi:ribosomal protein S1